MLKHFITSFTLWTTVKIILTKLYYVIYSNICSVGWHIRLFIFDNWINPTSMSWVMSCLSAGGPLQKIYKQCTEKVKDEAIILSCSPKYNRSIKSYHVFSSICSVSSKYWDGGCLHCIFISTIINGKMQVKGEALNARYGKETHTLQTTKPEKNPAASLKRLSLRQEIYFSFGRILGALEKIQRNNRLVGKIH